jgi:hypothetical protein
MRRQLALLATAVLTLGCCAAAQAEWIFRPSSYTHDPATAQRVTQFARAETPQVRVDPTYQQSAYRHNRSSLRVGGSADHLHVVETWGQGENIRPYGEWLRPFREGATPYGPWGNPQGPWTDPYGAWVNPYGLGRLPYYGSGPNDYSGPYASPYHPGQQQPGPGPNRQPQDRQRTQQP